MGCRRLFSKNHDFIFLSFGGIALPWGTYIQVSVTVIVITKQCTAILAFRYKLKIRGHEFNQRMCRSFYLYLPITKFSPTVHLQFIMLY